LGVIFKIPNNALSPAAVLNAYQRLALCYGSANGMRRFFPVQCPVFHLRQLNLLKKY
jgi:hypothetical protein